MKKVFRRSFLKKNLVLACTALLFIATIFQSGCTKDTGKSNGPGNTTNSAQTIADITSALSTNDSLQQFVALFKSLSLSDADIAGGITVLALNNNALINPVNTEDLKDYIIKGVVAPSDFTNGKVFTSITGKSITITILNGKTYANGVVISASSAVASASNYSIYASAGLYVTGLAAYNDPHKSEYYLEYYENGVYHSLSGNYITSWQFFNLNNFPSPVAGNCSYPSYTSYSSGPSQATVAFVADNPFALQINRTNFTTIPVPGDYKISAATYNASQNKNTGNCNLVINGAVFGCDLGDKDSYVHVNITEVKVDEDLGLEKRGYYRGEFDAILYYTAHTGGSIEKRVITGGRFMAPMGGNQTTPISGTAPALDRFKILTTGKWYLRPTILLDPDAAPCNLDDYIVFTTDGIISIMEGSAKCKPHEGDVDYGSSTWAFKNNQTGIMIGAGADAEDWSITEFSNDQMVLSGMILTHGN